MNEPKTIRVLVDFELDNPQDYFTIMDWIEQLQDEDDNFVLPSTIKRHLTVGYRENFKD